MSNSQSAVRRHSTPEQALGVAARDRRSIPPEQTSAENSEANPAVAQADKTWLSMVWLFVEGFAVYGASLPGFATTAVTAIGSQSPAEEFDRYRSVHPGWLSMIWRTIASGRARRRREREIKQAVAALAEYDDRLLRDMGFSDRSQIEQVVRNGRDC